MSSCLVVLLACSSLGSDDDLILNELTSDFVSSDLWIENSRELIFQINSEIDRSTYFAELPGENLSIEIVLNQNNEVSKVNVPLTPSLSKTLYFDFGRLSFAQTEMDGVNYLLSAYADSKVYAHALPDGSTPSAAQIKLAELKEHTLQSIISLAQVYSRKEKKASHNIRITEREVSVNESVELQKDFTAVMNVKQGEKIEINLSSAEPHIYFTLSPSIGSDMEHRYWRGPATFTGDIEIRVFTAEDIKDVHFKLDVKRL